MRRPLLLAVAALLLSSASAHAASPAAGLWRLEGEDASIRISECGRTLCGRLVAADKLKRDPRAKDTRNEDRALRGRPLRNLLVLSGFIGGPDEWTDGEVYNPDDGSTYQAEMQLVSRDTLKVEVCVLRPLCKTQTLIRVR